MPKLTEAKQTPDTLRQTIARIQAVAMRIQAYVDVMEIAGIAELMVKHETDRSLGITRVESFANGLEKAVNDYREARGDFRASPVRESNRRVSDVSDSAEE